MHHGAMRVGQDLQLDMAGPVEVFLEIDGVIAEGRAGFGAGDAPGFFQFVRGLGHLHAAAAAAGSGLDQHGVADLLGDQGGLG